MTISNLLLESFCSNARVNQALLNALTPTDLGAIDGRGGWSLGKHLGHIADFWRGRLSLISPEVVASLSAILNVDWQQFDLAKCDLAKLAEAFRLSNLAALNVSQTALKKSRTFI